MPFGVQRGWMRYALPRPEILAYPLETNVIDSVVLNSAGVAPDAAGPFMNRRYMIAGTVLSKRPDNTYERYTNAAALAAINNQWTVTLIGPPTGGTWALAFEGATTPQQPYNVTGAALQAALQALGTVGAANMTVAGPVNDANGQPVYTITAAGTLAGQDLPNFDTDGTQLVGPGNQDVQSVVTTRGQAAEATQNVAGVLFDTVEFADGSELSDEPVAMLRRNVSFKQSAIIDFAAHQAQITAGLPTCEFV